MKPEQKLEQAVTPQREIAQKQEQGEDFGLGLSSKGRGLESPPRARFILFSELAARAKSGYQAYFTGGNMSWLRRLLQPFTKPTEAKKDFSPSVRYAMEAMPTIKFNPSVVTKEVKADLRRNVELLVGVEKKHVKQIYEVALRSIVGRRDFHSFCTEMMDMHIEGMTSSKAAEIGRF
jgi:hypothetical protein